MIRRWEGRKIFLYCSAKVVRVGKSGLVRGTLRKSETRNDFGPRALSFFRTHEEPPVAERPQSVHSRFLSHWSQADSVGAGSKRTNSSGSRSSRFRSS